ncbi:MAG: hypothetical protein ABI876_02630, partial [Bacteroidota bacterium]
SHMRSYDALLHRIVYPAYESLSKVKALMEKTFRGKGCLRWFLAFVPYSIAFLSFIIVSQYFSLFHYVNSRLRFRQELRADANAAAIAGSATYRNALLKIAGFEFHINEFIRSYDGEEIEMLDKQRELFPLLCNNVPDIAGLGMIAAADNVRDDFHRTFVYQMLLAFGVFLPESDEVEAPVRDPFHPTLALRLRELPIDGLCASQDETTCAGIVDAGRYEARLGALLVSQLRSRIAA